MGNGIRTGIPGAGAKTRGVTVGINDWYYQESPHSSKRPSAHNPNLCSAAAKHLFVDKQQRDWWETEKKPFL